MTGKDHKMIINCWSGPRCVSTSLMRSFAQRSDTEVLDEPLYAHYLRLNPGATRPYRDLVMAAQDPDGDAVVQNQIFAPRQRPILYVKHMSKQRQGIKNDLLERGQHILLVRSPTAVIRSFSKVLAPTLHDACYTSLLDIYSELRSMGKPPIVVLSEDLVAHPEPMLRAVCSALHIPFDTAMLSWPPAARPEDGVWAPWWYETTNKSTGFYSASKQGERNSSGQGLEEEEQQEEQEEGVSKKAEFPPELCALLEECRPLYEMLRQRALRPPRDSSLLETSSFSTKKLNKEEEMRGTHAHIPNNRNSSVLVGMRDGVTGAFDLVPRPFAKVSVLDSGFMLGDGVWEGIRQHNGVLLFADAHIKRLYEGAKALDMKIDLTPTELLSLVYKTLDANGMHSGVHVRLMVTRGLKATPYQHPKVTIGDPTIVILPEYKQADQGPLKNGIRLFTVHVRRGAPDVQDPGLNSHSKLNCIAACIQATKAGADEALMLDPRGFVATCNSTNFFIVRGNEVWAPGPQYQMPGITRSNVLQICGTAGITALEKDFALAQVYSADDVFVTGTFAGVLPVVEVDGRVIGQGKKGPMVDRLQLLYKELCDKNAAAGRAV